MGVNRETHLGKRKTRVPAAQTRCCVVPEGAGAEGSLPALPGCPGRADDVNLYPKKSQELPEFETEAWYEQVLCLNGWFTLGRALVGREEMQPR